MKSSLGEWDVVAILTVLTGGAIAIFLYIGIDMYRERQPSPVYTDGVTCTQAGGIYRRLATGDRYVCYLPVRTSP